MAEASPRNPRTIAMKMNQRKPGPEPKASEASQPVVLKETGTAPRSNTGGESPGTLAATGLK